MSTSHTNPIPQPVPKLDMDSMIRLIAYPSLSLHIEMATSAVAPSKKSFNITTTPSSPASFFPVSPRSNGNIAGVLEQLGFISCTNDHLVDMADKIIKPKMMGIVIGSISD